MPKFNWKHFFAFAAIGIASSMIAAYYTISVVTYWAGGVPEGAITIQTTQEHFWREWISATNGIVGGIIGGGMTIGAALLAWKGVQKQIAVSEIPHKREAAYLVLQEMHCCNVVSLASESDLIDGFIQHLDDRANCLENGVEPTPMLDDFHEAMEKYDNTAPKIAVLFGDAERGAHIEAYRSIADYLDKGLYFTYKFYRSGLRVDDPQKVRSYIQSIISFEGATTPKFKQERKVMREKAVAAEKHYAKLLQDLYDKNSV